MQNTTEKPVKVSSYRGETIYTYKGHRIYTERKTERTYSCGLCRSTSWTSTHVGSKAISGGLKDAVRLINAGKI
jgi:hypothetical protein